MQLTLNTKIKEMIKLSGKQDQVILLSHGDGGALTRELICSTFMKYLDVENNSQMSDAATIATSVGRWSFTIDAYVVDPIFFPGGDIGKLAVCGTVNDLAVSGARPEYLAVSYIIEEGFSFTDLERILQSVQNAVRESGIKLVTGDTKVVPRGQADKLFITTAGIGFLPPELELGSRLIRPGDKILVNGNLGEHGLCILSTREDFGIKGLESDCAPLNNIIEVLLKACPGVKMMRDLTRGGLATCIKEIALEAGVDIWLEESLIPVSGQVLGASEILGLEPLYLANEGKFLAIVENSQAFQALKTVNGHPLGSKGNIIGEVRAGEGKVYLKTKTGSTRVINLMSGLPLPRIC